MTSSRKRGRPVRAPATELGQFVQKYMEAMSMTRARLAHSLRVSPSTISRFLNDETVVPRSISLENLAIQLRLDPMNRRKLLQLAAGTLGVVVVGPTKYHHFDLEAIDLALDGWIAAYQQQVDPRQVLGKVSRIFALLQERKPDSDDERFDETTVRAGMLLAALQEAVLPWGTERPKIATRTYNVLDEQIFQKGNMDKFSTDYARLILRRAVLFRENDWSEECELMLDGTKASRLVRSCADPRIAIAFGAQHTHTLAVMGRYHEWQAAMDTLRNMIESLQVDAALRQELHGIADYTMGVGYKRFMWGLRHDESQAALREYYAQESVKWLRKLQANSGGGRATHNINLYHPVVADSQSLPELQAAELDALAWYDPEETLLQTERLRPQAEMLYPAVLRKLDLTISLCRRRLGLKEA